MRQVDFYFDKILRFSYLTDNVTKTDIYLYLSSKCHSRLNPQLKIAAERLKSDKRSLYASKIFYRKSCFCFLFDRAAIFFLPDIAQSISGNSKIKTKSSSEISGIRSGAYFFILYVLRAIKIDNAGVFHECGGAWETKH